MSVSQSKSQKILRKRSLSELDDVIEEMLDRNPDLVIQLEKVIEEKLKEQDALSRRSRSS